MSSDRSFWHTRYHQQAGWTLDTRRYIFDTIGISPHERLLEVGCGSGAVLETLAHDGYAHLYGLDRDISTLMDANISHPHVCADGLKIPFANASFAHCLCHFYLLWVTDPLIALQEMTRVTKPGGWVLALAEPDCGGRISFPHALEQIGELQTRSLELQGVDTHMGRRLISLFNEIGLEDVLAGIIPAQCGGSQQADPFLQDRDILARDLKDLIEPDELDSLLSQAEESASSDDTMWFVPIYYAYGRVPLEAKG